MGAAMALSQSGCTGLREYVQNGFKVGPNYCRPPARVAERWIDADDKLHRVKSESDDLGQWWTVFKDPVVQSEDPVLNHLIFTAYRQNLTLRQAGFRILEARAQLGIARGTFFPQLQDAVGSYRREGINQNFFDQWNFGFNLAWELDFWGRFRRAIEAADDQLDASIEDYDFVLVTLLGDVATNYVQIRTDQQRLTLLRKNVKLQEGVLKVVRRWLEEGVRGITAIDVNQAESNLKQTQAQIPQLEIDLRLAMNRLCILLGKPPEELQKSLDVWRTEDLRKAEELRQAEEALSNLLRTADLTKTEEVQKLEKLWRTIGTVYIPTVPDEVAVGIPAELLRRRPDVQRAECQAAAQAEQIGIAQSDLYPAFTINGTLGYQAGEFSHLFTSNAFNGSVGPSFQWNLLNYGRIVHNVRLQDARFQELVVAYQNTVLQANEEVENGLVTFLRAQERAELLGESARAGQRAVSVALAQFGAGAIQFNQYAVIEQSLVQQEDSWAQARGQIALGLIQVYKALGGGWEIRLQPEGTTPAVLATPPSAPGVPPGNPGTLPNAPEVLEEPPIPPQPARKPAQD